MDFSSILSKASENKVVSQVPKRYSLSVKPLKKKPQVKVVQSTAVQAFLKRREEELKNKDLEERRRKAELLAKRVALKHDRKARAMATRTKDNFRGYDGIPVEQKSKKKTSDDEAKDQIMDDYNEDYYYDEAQGEDELSEVEDSEEFEEPMHERPVKQQHMEVPVKQQHMEVPVKQQHMEVPVKRRKHQHREPVISSKEPKRHCKELETSTKEPEQLFREAKKSKVPKKPPSAPMNFSDLLKLAEKKQFEPVELKPIKKVEEKLYTAEELKEIEFLERKRQKQNDKRKPEKESTLSHPTSSSKKESSTKDSKNTKLVRDPGEKLNLFRESNSATSVRGVNKKPKTASSEKPSSSVSYKTSTQEKSRSSVGIGHSISKNSSSNVGKPVLNSSAKSGISSQTPSKGLKPGSNGTHSAVSSKNSQRRTELSTSARKNDGSSIKHERTGGSNALHSKSTSDSASERSKGSSNLSQKRPASSDHARLSNLGQHKSGSAINYGASRPNKMGGSDSMRPKDTSNSGPSRQSNTCNSGSVQSRGMSTSVRVASSGSERSGNSSVSVSGRHPSTDAGRPGNRVEVPKPKCTVVSETISSKNFPSRPNSGQMNNVRSAPPGYRSLAHPSAPTRPPMAISYRRRLEDDDEYDSEMDDFIDDSGVSQDEISRHIKAIFGYDRTRYKDESDYALRYMESSWKEQQKEEAKSLQMGMMEDAEELQKEEEELRRKMKAKKRRL
ncbi:protein SPT2 homolog isoform X3 [Chiloscyllium plagiosum]|uniref:protein SPT2 homolog isoform X2 n=1 Tax=Chiloscyllium plagiosum TaxID=36176 RepID=UPI001CB7EFDC|nr:protein SPT2 homolog isoform X2 [Chiloscyllium plagiosum]XP_043561953.1 protein SPT2 homolog isoform X3 [Chiloscyllium plagiosum]